MYCTQQDLEQRFGRVELEAVAWDADANALDADKIDRACADATSTIELYTAGSIATPPDTPPPILVSIASDIARYQLQSDRPLDEVKDRYASAMKLLRDIADGKATLLGDGASSTGGNVEALRDDDDRTFTTESLEGF